MKRNKLMVLENRRTRREKEEVVTEVVKKKRFKVYDRIVAHHNGSDFEMRNCSLHDMMQSLRAGLICGEYTFSMMSKKAAMVLHYEIKNGDFKLCSYVGGAR